MTDFLYHVKMKFITVLTCLLIAFCTRTAAEVRIQRYTVDPDLDNKVSTTSLLATHPSLSLTECSAMCNGVCSCFGFNPIRKECRIHQTCDPSEITTEETGWRYYSPAGMFSHNSLLKCLKQSHCANLNIEHFIHYSLHIDRYKH